MFSLSKPIDAVKKLNEDFGLHIEIGKVPTAEEVSEYQKWIAEKRAYEVWEKSAWKTLQDYLWLMREWREFAPASPDEKCNERFVYSLHHLDYAEYLCDEFIRADKQGKISMKNIVSEIADYMENQSRISDFPYKKKSYFLIYCGTNIFVFVTTSRLLRQPINASQSHISIFDSLGKLSKVLWGYWRRTASNF